MLPLAFILGCTTAPNKARPRTASSAATGSLLTGPYALPQPPAIPPPPRREVFGNVEKRQAKHALLQHRIPSPRPHSTLHARLTLSSRGTEPHRTCTCTSRSATSHYKGEGEERGRQPCKAIRGGGEEKVGARLRSIQADSSRRRRRPLPGSRVQRRRGAVLEMQLLFFKTLLRMVPTPPPPVLCLFKPLAPRLRDPGTLSCLMGAGGPRPNHPLARLRRCARGGVGWGLLPPAQKLRNLSERAGR